MRLEDRIDMQADIITYFNISGHVIPGQLWAQMML